LRVLGAGLALNYQPLVGISAGLGSWSRTQDLRFSGLGLGRRAAGTQGSRDAEQQGRPVAGRRVSGAQGCWDAGQPGRGHASMGLVQGGEALTARVPFDRGVLAGTRNPDPGSRVPNPESRIQSPEPQNLKLETRNPNPQTRNPKPETRNPKPRPLNPKPGTAGGATRRDGRVCPARRRPMRGGRHLTPLYHSTLGLRVIQKQKKNSSINCERTERDLGVFFFFFFFCIILKPGVE